MARPDERLIRRGDSSLGQVRWCPVRTVREEVAVVGGVDQMRRGHLIDELLVLREDPPVKDGEFREPRLVFAVNILNADRISAVLHELRTMPDSGLEVGELRLTRDELLGDIHVSYLRKGRREQPAEVRYDLLVRDHPPVLLPLHNVHAAV